MNNNFIKKLAILAIALLILTSTNVFAFAYYNDLTREQSETILLGEWLENAVPISTASEFYNYMTKTDSESTDIYFLENDIDFTDFDWKIDSSNSDIVFRGILDGNGHTISNLTIYTNETNHKYFGLFPTTEGATIQNIVFNNLNLTLSYEVLSSANMRSGLLVGRIVGGENNFKGITIIDSTITGSSTYGTGGLIGQVYGKTSIVNIDSIKTVNFKGFTRRYYIGGLIGYIYGKKSTVNITNIDLDSELYSANRSAYIGGVVGNTRSGSTLNISNAIIKVYSINTFLDYQDDYNQYAYRYLGGVIGYNRSKNFVIKDTYITGELLTSNTTYRGYVGTLIGKNNGSYLKENTYYSNVSFRQSDGSIDYTPSNPIGIMADEITSNTIPDMNWWNEFYTNFDEEIWSQDSSGIPILSD